MRAMIKFDAPAKMQATLTITGTMQTFEALRDGLDSRTWPSFELRSALTEAIHDVNKTFYGNSTDDAK